VNGWGLTPSTREEKKCGGEFLLKTKKKAYRKGKKELKS
jgi:hypothetical protein